MATYESVFLGHDNIIDLVLTADGETVSIVNTTRATAVFGTTLIDSETSMDVFDWSEGEEGLLHLTFGEESIPVGSYKVVLTLYDVINTDGVVWDDFRCRVVGEDLSPVPPTDPPILISQGGTGQSTASAAFNALKQIASETYTGVTELATTAECVTGTDTLRVVTPAGLTARIDDLQESLYPAAQMCYVSPDFIVDTEYRRFPKIQDAIDAIHDASWFGELSDSNKALVKVGPGKYEEQINSYEHIVIASYTSGFDTIDISPPATLYNTGADSLHYPLRSDEDEIYAMVGMNIETEVGGVIGKIPNGNFFSCRFNGGHFIERNSSNVVIFSNCSVLGSVYGGFYFEGTNLTGNRNIILRQNCNIGLLSTSEFLSTHTGFANFKCTDVDVEGSVNIKGDWDWRVTRCCGYRLAQRNIIDTTGLVTIVDTTILNGLHFVSNPSSFKMITSSFEGISDNKIPDGEPDITSDTTIMDTVYSGNTQHNGLCGCIQITNPEKHVGGGKQDKYFNLQHAIDSVPSGETATVRVWEDLTDLPEISLPNANVNIKIKGQKSYSLSFTGDIVEIGNDRIFGFNDITQLSGGNIELNGTSNELGFESCQYINAYVTLTAGTFAILYNSSLFGSAGHKAIYINNTDTIAVVGYSRVQGATGQPAIEFNANADTKLKAKFSTFIHGDKSTTCPLLNSTVTPSINIAVYTCGVNKLWSSPNPFYNVVAKAGIIDDTEISF